MKVLFATTNPAKVKKFNDKLLDKNIELLTLNDVDVKLDIDESGKNAIENAYIKAKAYYDATGIPSIGMDNCLFIEGLPDDKQPGTHVRRVGGRELSDDEMLEHYTSLVKKYGGRLTARWVYGMVIFTSSGYKTYSWNHNDFYLVDKPSTKREVGYPLDSMSIDPILNKYFVDITPEDKKRNKKDDTDDVVNFIVSCLENMEEDKAIQSEGV